MDEAFLDITEEVEQQLIDEFAQKYTMIRDELVDVESAELVESEELDALDNLALYDTSWIDSGLDYTDLGEGVIVEVEMEMEMESSSVYPDDIVERMRMSLGKLRIWKGAQIAKDLRAHLRTELNFIASIGIASNKMLAKLLSALYKPDKQTRIDPSAISLFMQRVPFEKIRMMGGKMGRSVLLSRATEEQDHQSDDSDAVSWDVN